MRLTKENSTIGRFSGDLMSAGFLFVESDPDTAPEVIAKLRTEADQMIEHANEIRDLATKMEKAESRKNNHSGD